MIGLPGGPSSLENLPLPAKLKSPQERAFFRIGLNTGVATMKERRESAEKERLEFQLRKDQPEFVKNFYCEFDEDLDGDPAVSVWAIVRDGEAEAEDFPEHLETTRSWISAALAETRIERWPYMRFRAESEVDPVTLQVL